MGLFGFGKKKEEVKRNLDVQQKAFTQQNTQLFRDLTQDIGILLFKMGVVQQPSVRFFQNDGGILQGMFVQHTTNPRILALKSMQGDTYLKVCGMHALGGGMYVTHMQSQFKKSVENFNTQELQSIATDWQQTDAYELALKTFGIPLQSQQKASLDQIYVIGTKCYKDFVKGDVDKPENILTFMQVMYNAGITIAMAG